MKRSAVLGVALSVMNAYALGIGRLRGRGWFLLFFLAANLIPQEALVYPLYYLSKVVHLYDSLTVLIIIFTYRIEIIVLIIHTICAFS